MATTESVALEPAEATIGDIVETSKAGDWQLCPEDEVTGESWMFAGERVIVDVFVVGEEGHFAEAEPATQTRWAVCLEPAPAEAYEVPAGGQIAYVTV
ncbi:MAG: hypothetical protein ACYS9X_29380 [Planctomycetota bacterium]|jgi:hypothetical protein